ncbi:MAG: HAD family hydrolase [Chloroflexi bacterium]|nr:HAD family hydrolase [Chloroflexota bacterium]
MFSPNGTQAILFDLDGTLRHTQPNGGEMFVEQARALGLRISEDDRLRGIRWEHYYWANSVDLRKDFAAHPESEPEFWVNYSRRQLVALGAHPAHAAELAPVLSAHMDKHYKPLGVLDSGALEVLTQLKGVGYRLGVVSNREKPFHGDLEGLGILPFFDLSLAAGEVKSYKPDPGIFQIALERMGIPAEAAVYVGDNYFADVVGSRRAGLRPVLYDPRGIFPDADCEVIESFGEFLNLLK